MAEGTNGNERRFQEISSLLEQLINSQKHLLQAQVILSDRQDRSEQLLAKLLEHQEITARNLSSIDRQLDRRSSPTSKLLCG